MVTTVTNNSPQSINTSLFSLDRDIQEIKKVTDKLKDISLESDVISVNGKRGIVELNASDVGALPDTTFIPSKTSDLENDSGFVTMEDVAESYVPLTRTINDKPLDEDITLTASDVGALPDTTVIPTKTSELTNDSGFITESSDITGNAATATRAEQDADGNVITDTYATKTELDNKVDKVSGKGLSTNDFTTAEKEKLAGLNNYDDSAVKTLIANETKAREDADKVLQTAIDGKAAASHNHDDRYYTETEINEKIYDINEKIGTLQENKNDLLDMCSDLYDKVANETSSRTEADTALQNQITANKSAIDTLNGTGEGSVQKTVTDEIAKVVANAPEDFDTLKEISDWIDTHKDSASAMNTAIQANATNLSNHINNKSNPHSVTKAQVGLGNVVNTGDSATPVSGGTTKFTTGGAYTELAKKNNKITVSEDYSTTLTDDHALTLITAGANPTTGKNRKLSQVWTYIKGKADSIYAKLSHTHTKSQITDFAHTHDDRYYTETEVTNKLAGKSDKGHTHTKSEITDFAHNHDDRYYTESEVDTKLSGKSDTGHKHSASDITSGVLLVANGGTGRTSANAAANSFINSLTVGTDVPVDNDYYIAQSVGGGTTATTYHRRPISKLWEYIKGKISSVLGLTATAYGGKAATAGTADKTVNDLSITIPHKTENTQYVILLGNIPEPTSKENNSPYNWDVCGFIDAIRTAGHQFGHIHFSAGHGYSHSWRTYVDCDYIGHTGIGGYPLPLDIKCFQYDGKWWLGIQMILGHSNYTCNAHITYKRGVPKEFLTAIPYYSNYNGELIYNEEINSSIQDVPSAWLVTRNWQNNIQAPTFIGALNGNASTATKATQDASGNVITSTYATKTELSGKANSSHTHTKSQITDFPTSLPANGGTADKATKDGNGNNIVNTYMPKSGGTFTGIVTGNEFHVNNLYPKNNIDSNIFFMEDIGGTRLNIVGNKALLLDSSEGNVYLKTNTEENAINKVVAKSYKVCKNHDLIDPNIPTFLSNSELTNEHKKILRKIFGAICLGKCLSLNLEVNYSRPGSTNFNTLYRPLTIIGGQEWDFSDAIINKDGVTFDNAVNVSNTYSYLGGLNDNGDFYSIDIFELATDIIRNDFSNVKAIKVFATIMENWI